ncbi:cell wall-binding repeat-containing protein [Gulosibacter bifidus]|uniref:cell wall-binding repeat-containing protein n=1 Tax=Gulosibacter bifidus TaxID=272239 RepID=UPI000826808A|nr:cell wall-binding repeat-containing protein [Gulosibacter bifidus]
MVAASIAALGSVLIAPMSADAAILNGSEIGGDNRFATADKVAAQVATGTGGTAVLATGVTYPDALAAGPVAAKLGAPILLTMGDKLPAETVTALKRQQPSRVIIVGGESAVPAAAINELKGFLPNAKTERYGGSNRHETAGMLATTFFPDTLTVFIATGWDFPDALTAGSAATSMDAPILLGHSSGLTPETKATIQQLSKVRRIYLAGGEKVLKYDFGGYYVYRFAGADRFETNAQIVNRFYPDATYKVYVAAANKFPDALVATPLAAKHKAPLLLSYGSCTGTQARTSAQRLLALNPFEDTTQQREIIRAGRGLEDKSVLAECGNASQTPWHIVRPAGLAKDDVTPTEIYNFVTEYNKIRVEHGLSALPASRFRVGINAYSDLSQRHADAHGSIGAHDGAINGNEVAYSNGDLTERYFDLSGVHSVRSWWNSAGHREVLFQPTNDAWYGGPHDPDSCIVFNMVRTRETSNRGWDSYGDARASWASCSDERTVPATSVDLRLLDYRMPTIPAGAKYNPQRSYDDSIRSNNSAYQYYLNGYTFDDYMRRRG